MFENSEMISLAEALDIVERELSGITLPAETVPVLQALGRVAAENQAAQIDVPPFNKSAMDGYAIGPGDELEEYTLIETVPAGCVSQKHLTSGTAIKVMIGAPVPHGTAKVVMIEHTHLTDGKVRILSHTKEINICPKDQDIRVGDIILSAPATLGALEIANLISVGVTEVKAKEKVKFLSIKDSFV
jgi:molybdopterin molybdotransferase